MVAAYSAFATLGTRAAADRRSCASRTRKGDVLWEPTPTRAPVMSPEEAWLMVSMMKDVVQRGTAAGSVGSQFHVPAGGKTGTTNDGTDVWFIGYTPDLVAGVWMGLDKPQTIKGNAQGGILAAPAWTSFMREVYRRKPAPPDWPRPEGIVERDSRPRERQLWEPGCGGQITEYFIAGTDPIATCIPAANPTSRHGSDRRRSGHRRRSTPSFGFPAPAAPAAAAHRFGGHHAASATTSPGVMVVARRRAAAARVGARVRRATRCGSPRDSRPAPRDTSNPFALPPSSPQRR